MWALTCYTIHAYMHVYGIGVLAIYMYCMYSCNCVKAENVLLHFYDVNK